MIFNWFGRRSKITTVVRQEVPEWDLDKDEELAPAQFYLLCSKILLEYPGFRVRNRVNKALKKGVLHWETPDGRTTLHTIKR